jgi:hypothetical protein
MAEQVITVCDVCGQPAEQSVTFKVGGRSLAQDLCATHLQDLVRHSHAPRRGRRPNASVAKAPASTAKRSKSSGRQAAKKATAKAATAKAAKTARVATAKAQTKAKATRRRITDPAVLEKRRAALAKAREALAKKRAGSKSNP